MIISDLKQLEALMKLCKKQGVPSIKIDNIEFQIDLVPTMASKPRNSAATVTIAPGGITDTTKIESFDGLTDEQKLFWSANGHNESQS